MAVKNHNFRFNEEKEAERQAWEILHSKEVKEDFRYQNEFVIAAINDYYARHLATKQNPYLESREKEDAFVKGIVEAVEKKVLDEIHELVELGWLELIDKQVRMHPLIQETMHQIPWSDEYRQIAVEEMQYLFKEIKLNGKQEEYPKKLYDKNKKIKQNIEQSDMANKLVRKMLHKKGVLGEVRAIAELNQVKQLYGQAIDTNKQLREQIQLLHRDIDAYKNKLSGFEAKLRVTEQENAEIKSSFWYKLFGKK